MSDSAKINSIQKSPSEEVSNGKIVSEKTKKHSTAISFASGIAAGMADTLVNYPPYGIHYRVSRGTNIWNKKYWTFKELYRGVGPYSAIIPVTCTMDGISEFLKSKGVHPAVATFSSGVIAAVFIGAPVGNIIVTDQRLAESKLPAGTQNAVRDILYYRGKLGFETGIAFIAAREGTYSFSVFYAKNAIKSYFDCNDFIASAIAGILATIVTQPMDTSASYMQNQQFRPRIIDSIKKMYAEEGLKRFYRGGFYRGYTVVAGIYVMDKVSTYVKEQLYKNFD